MPISGKRRRADMGELEKEFMPAPIPKFTKEQLDDFGVWIEKFREEKTISEYTKETVDGIVMRKKVPRVVGIINIQEAMVTFGAMKKRMHIHKPVYEIVLKAVDFDQYGNPKAYETPSMYERFMDKYEQWQRFKSNTEYGDMKRMEAYQDLAEQVGVLDHE